MLALTFLFLPFTFLRGLSPFHPRITPIEEFMRTLKEDEAHGWFDSGSIRVYRQKNIS
jgi:hypothetical protein